MRKRFIVLLAGIGGVVALLASVDPPDRDEIGYWKSENRNRVFAYAGVKSPDDLVNNLTNTEGRLTIAVGYEGPRDPMPMLTRAKDLGQAIDVIEANAAWRWRVSVYPTGIAKIQECDPGPPRSCGDIVDIKVERCSSTSVSVCLPDKGK